jgi:hypothetical protein
MAQDPPRPVAPRRVAASWASTAPIAWLVIAGAALVAGTAGTACGGDDAPPTPDASGDLGAGGEDLGAADASGEDAGAPDLGAEDAGGDDAGAPDLGDVDAGPMCGGETVGWCADPALGCQCCPAGGPRNRCLCTTTCLGDADCRDPDRPRCNKDPTTDGPGICTSREFACAWGAVCASPDTPIATPTGERPIADLRAGDLVWSLHEGALRAVPLLAVHRRPVTAHHVVRVTLDTGRVVEMSEGHPAADGRPFATLIPGEILGNVAAPAAAPSIRALELVPYAHDATYDILPDSDTGTYVAAGALVGSTLSR